MEDNLFCDKFIDLRTIILDIHSTGSSVREFLLKSSFSKLGEHGYEILKSAFSI
jgi:hypothetical protein